MADGGVASEGPEPMEEVSTHVVLEGENSEVGVADAGLAEGGVADEAQDLGDQPAVEETPSGGGEMGEVEMDSGLEAVLGTTGEDVGVTLPSDMAVAETDMTQEGSDAEPQGRSADAEIIGDQGNMSVMEQD